MRKDERVLRDLRDELLRRNQAEYHAIEDFADDFDRGKYVARRIAIGWIEGAVMKIKFEGREG